MISAGKRGGGRHGKIDLEREPGPKKTKVARRIVSTSLCF